MDSLRPDTITGLLYPGIHKPIVQLTDILSFLDIYKVSLYILTKRQNAHESYNIDLEDFGTRALLCYVQYRKT